jgi:hypothetical protein
MPSPQASQSKRFGNDDWKSHIPIGTRGNPAQIFGGCEKLFTRGTHTPAIVFM